MCALSSIYGRKFGIYRDIVFVYAKTLEEAKFKFKTFIGISRSLYVHCAKFPIIGTGQGFTNYPMIWTFVSSVLFYTHAKTCNGMVFSSPDGNYFVQYTIVGFVNNSTCITSGSKDNSYDNLKSKMTHDAQLWHDLFFVSGGKLELPKCGYHLVCYDFDYAGLPQMRISAPRESSTLKDDNGIDVQIKAKSIFQPRKNLDHYKAPSGNRSIQAKK